MKRPILAIVVVLLSLATMGQAHAEELLAYDGCYEISIARPRPQALIDPTLPPGFAAAPFLHPASGLGLYGIVGYQCAVGSETVSELLSLVAVNPPPEFAGADQTYLLLQGTTSRVASAALYSAWCLSSFEHGPVTLEHQVNPAVRSGVITAAHSDGDISASTVVAEPALQSGPAGTLRVIDVNDAGTGILDLDYTASVGTAPGPALVTIGGIVEPAAGLHIFGSGDEAPNDWSLHGRCVSDA